MIHTTHDIDQISNNHQEINGLMSGAYNLERAIRPALTLDEIEKDLSTLCELRGDVVRLTEPTEEFATDLITLVERGEGDALTLIYLNQTREFLRSSNHHIAYINEQIHSLEVLRKTKSTLFYRFCEFIGIK